MTKTEKLMIYSSLLALAVSMPAMASAQTAPDSAPTAPDGSPQGVDAAKGTNASDAQSTGEIVVTATRQSQVLSRVPISVAAFSQQTMDAKGVRGIADITRLTPGLSLTPGPQDLAGGSQTISIRGISSVVGAATTGIYIDDTPIQSRSLGNAASSAFPQVFDLDRVEVLRGPQGTLFGAGAEGGAVRFITPQPSLSQYSGYARAEIAATEGGAPSYEAGGAIGGPLVDGKLGFRISGWYRRDGGYIDRVDPTTRATVEANANRLDSYVVRGALRWQPLPGLDATLSVFRQQTKSNDASSFYVLYSDPANGKFANPRVTPSSLRDRFTLPSLNINYEAGAIKIISTTSYFARDVDRDQDYTNFIAAIFLGDPYAYAHGEASTAQVNDSQREITQEIRIQSNKSGPLTWVLGGFYSHSVQRAVQLNDDRYLNIAETRLGLPLLPLLDGVSLYQTHARSVDTQKALFAQVDYELIAGLKATAGVRVARVDSNASRQSAGFVAGGAASFNASQGETPVTPKFGLSYQASSATLLYATAAKGFRIGGVNGPQLATCASALSAIGIASSPTTYKSDSLWSYEGGVKTKLLNGKVRVEASAFYIKWSDIQQNVQLSSCGSNFITNFGKASSTGFDLSVEVHPISELTLSGSVGYADTKLTQTVGGGNVFYGLAGDKIGGPPWSWTLAGEYAQPIGLNKSAYFRADYQHAGRGADIDYNVFGIDPLVPPSQAYDQVSLRAGARFHGIDLSVFVFNLLNQTPRISLVRYPSVYLSNFVETTLRPRTFGATATYRF